MVDCKLGDIAFSLPTSYGELTYNQFVALKDMSDTSDIVGIFSILSGVEKSIIEQSGDLDLDEKIISLIKFLEKLPNLVFLLPDQIYIGDKWYQKPTGIEVNTFGQKLSLQRKVISIQKEGKGEVDIYPFIVALYMQPAITGTPYDEDEVDRLVPLIMECKINQLFPIASFFLKSYELSLQKKRSDSRILLSKKSDRQGLTVSKSSESYQRFSVLRRFLIKILKKYFWKNTISFT